jgi:hypothetical protein
VKEASYRKIFFQSWRDGKGRDQAKAAHRWEGIYLREVDSAAIDPWEVMPAPIGPIYPWRESGKTAWECVLILGVTNGKKYFLRTSAVTDALEQGARAGIMGA